MLLVTVIILVIFTLLSFVIFDRDIFAPPTVVSLGLLFSSLCAFYNEKKWALDYSGFFDEVLPCQKCRKELQNI